jgi:hypothetical protein
LWRTAALDARVGDRTIDQQGVTRLKKPTKKKKEKGKAG